MANRRRFIQSGAALGAFGAIGPATAQPTESIHEVKEYRRLGKTELKISDISFGTSRLRRGSEALIHEAVEKGINYFDSAEGYTRGQSETVLGNALRDGKRDKVYLVSKALLSAHTRAEDIMERLEASLTRLQTDHVDVYMNHAVNDVDVVANPEWLKFVETAKKQGKIRFAGVSGHGGYLVECLDYVLDADIVDVILCAYNFGQDPKFYEGLTRGFDMIATQPDLPRVLAKAKQKDVGVVAMKTLQGARLNDMRPYEKGGNTYAQAAFKWVLSNPDVDALVITMTDSAQMNEYLGGSGAGPVLAGDMQLLRRYAVMQQGTYCKHACNSCESACPVGVPIADVMRTRMYATDYGDVEFARDEYALLGSAASACLSCSGEPCQNACPHGIEVNRLCAPTHRMLAREVLA